jgi:precorrin-4 methylase
MAEHHSSIHFEDVPLDEARQIGRGPRMEPQLYDTIRQKIQSLGEEAVRIRLGPEISSIRMKNYLLRIARDLKIRVTVRRVSGGVIFWRSSDEDVQHSREIAERLQSTQQPRRQRAPRRPARARTS